MNAEGLSHRPRKQLTAWIRAARPLAAGNVLIPVIFGAVFAAQARPLSTGGLVWACVWAWLDQLLIVFTNDLADEQVDRLGPGSAMSGGSRVLVEGQLERAQLWRGAAFVFTLWLGLSAWLSWRSESLVPLACTTAALVLLWAYSFRPLRLSYGRGGMAAQAIGMGIVLPIFGWHLQGRSLDTLPLLALIPTVCLAASSHLLTALPDLEGDRRGQKLTRVVRIGEARARIEAFALMLLAIIGAYLSTPLALLPTLAASALVLLAFAFARRMVHDRVGRVRFAWTGLVTNSALWLGWIWTLWRA